MQIQVFSYLTLDGKNYKVGTHNAPDNLKYSWYFQYCLDIGFIKIINIENTKKGKR